MWNVRDHGASKMNHHQPYQRPVFIQRRWCCIYGGIAKGALYYELLLENQVITFNKYCSQLGQLKAALNRKCAELVNRKSMISRQDNTRPHVLWWPGKTCYSLPGKFWFICRTHHILHLQISIHFGLYKILLIEKNFNSLEYFKRHLEQLFAQKEKMS